MTDERRRQRRLERAQERMAHGDLEGACEILQHILAEDPDDATAHAVLALCLVDRKLIGPAEAEAAAALASDADDPLAHAAMASVAVANRKLESAAEHIDRALELEPEHTGLLLQKARIEDLRGRPCRTLLDQALQLDPDDADILAAISEEELSRGNVQNAEDFALRALTIDPENHDALLAMGWVALRKGDVDDAREHAVMAIRQSVGAEDSLRLLAAIKARESIFLGLWFRWNMWMSSFGGGASIAILVVAYLLYRILSAVLGDLDHDAAASFVNLGWLGVVAYTWIAPGVFSRMLARELEDVDLRDDF